MSLLNFWESGLFRADSLSWVMASLIVMVAMNVIAFSRRYLAGDSNRGLHIGLICLLALSVLAMVFADHLVVMLAAWSASNLLLVRLMIHKWQWAAARNSGILALKSFAMGLAFLFVGSWLLADAAGSPYVHVINAMAGNLTVEAKTGLLLIAAAAMTQSAAWPFHRWLLSSLNSPTPVSALMHAGLVNGGGFLLVRFGPLFLGEPGILHFLFVAGLLTAVTGTFWKLLQGDIKRMLACSTMGQMGFMLMQCGMGLFAAAVSHLCWHGLFKAYSFLNAAAVIREKRIAPDAAGISLFRCVLACAAGVAGAGAFARLSGIAFDLETTGSLMGAIAFMTSAQLALRFPGTPRSIARIFVLPLIGLVAGASYGVSVRLIESILEPMNLNQVQPLDALYLTGFAILVLIWVAMNANLAARLESLDAWKRLYVMALNGSQPHSKTITADRASYEI